MNAFERVILGTGMLAMALLWLANWYLYGSFWAALAGLVISELAVLRGATSDPFLR